MNEFWSWALTIIGVTGFFLVGRKVWWAWWVNVANQAVWAAYSIFTEQWGFLFGVAVYSVVFFGNAMAWTNDHRDDSWNSMSIVTEDQANEISRFLKDSYENQRKMIERQRDLIYSDLAGDRITIQEAANRTAELREEE